MTKRDVIMLSRASGANSKEMKRRLVHSTVHKFYAREEIRFRWRQFLKNYRKGFFFFSVLCTVYNKQKEHEKTKIHLIAVKGHCSACLFLFFHTSCLHIDAFWSDSTQAADLCIRIRNRFLPQSLTSCWKISRKGLKSGVLFTLCRKLSQSTIRRFYSASGSTCLCLRENVMSFVYFTDDNMFYLEL